MGNDYLTPYLDELLSTSKNHYLKIRRGHEQENIHQLRVSLKKVNALFRLAAYLEPQTLDRKLAFQPMKQAFDLSGEVRDLQIVIQVFAQYESNAREPIQRSLNNELEMAIESLMKWKKGKPGSQLFVLDEPFAKTLKSISRVRLLKGSVAFMERLYRRIEKLRNSKKRDKWHQIRISLKRIRFIMDFCLRLKDDFVSPEINERVRLLETLLGDWHDRVIVMDKIRLLSRDSKVTTKRDDHEFFKTISNDQRSLLAAARFYLKDLLVQIR